MTPLHTYGDVRADGMRFVQYNKNAAGDGFIECWSDPVVWEASNQRKLQRNREYKRKKAAERRAQRIDKSAGNLLNSGS